MALRLLLCPAAGDEGARGEPCICIDLREEKGWLRMDEIHNHSDISDKNRRDGRLPGRVGKALPD